MVTESQRSIYETKTNCQPIQSFSSGTNLCHSVLFCDKRCLRTGFCKIPYAQHQAHDLTQASQRAGDVAELITASTSPDDMKNLLEDAYSDAVNIASENFTIFYDSDFIPCSQETAVWQLSGTWNLNGQLLDVQLDVTKLTSGVEADVFYQLPVRHHLQRRNGS